MSIYESVNHALSYVPLFIIANGVIGNTICFLIFRFNSNFKNMSSMVYLSFAVIVDTISLFDWNLKHFTVANFNFNIDYVTIYSCKFLPFLQYFSLQASGWLLSFVSLDRFISIRSIPGSFYSKLPFSTNKSAAIWSTIIIVVLLIMNCHILILNGYYNDPVPRNHTFLVEVENGTFKNITETYMYQDPNVVCYIYKNGFKVWPTWEAIHLFIYSFIPATIMMIFNSMLIYTTLIPLKNGPASNESESALRKKRKVTISLLVVTFSFILLSLPANIVWGYMSDWVGELEWGTLVFNVLDYILFLNHSNMFFFCYISNKKFRSVVNSYFGSMLRKNNQISRNQSKFSTSIRINTQ
jgi:hypothetical protein